MNNLNILNNDLSISKQREKLLKLNPDLLYWVYEIKTNLEDWTKYDWEEQDEIRLELLDNTLTCYPNQLDNLKWLNENQDILIVDLNELRKWKFKILAWKNNNDLAENITNLCLLSNWVIEIINSEYKDSNWKVKERVHIPLSSRDWWAADINQKTTVAWRNFWSNLIEE